MKKLISYWYVPAFLLLTGIIFVQQRTFLSTKHYYEYLFEKPRYSFWPATTFQKPQDLNAAASPSDIVMFRGNPARQGWIQGSLGQQYQLEWSYPFFNSGAHNAAKGSPVADDDGIYIGSDMGWFYHFGWDGKLKWKIFHETALKGIHGTPTIDGDFLFYGDYSGYLLAVNKKTGEVLWTRHLGDTLGASPLVLGDVIYANIEMNPSEGYIAKIDKYSGELLFKSRLLGEQSHSSPAYDETYQYLIFGANNSVLFSVDTDKGETPWFFQAPGQIKSTPVIYEGQSYYTDWGKRFSSNDNKTGNAVFSQPIKTMAINSPALSKNGLVVADRENLYLFSFKGELLKEVPLRNTFFLGSPLIVRDSGKESILIACNNTDLCVIDDSLKNEKVLFKGERKFSSVPFVFKDRIIFSQDDGDLVVLKKSK
ncbi:outer membrane biogenesis protein BamB [compost metagenome]